MRGFKILGFGLLFFWQAPLVLAGGLGDAYRAFEKGQYEEAAKGFKEHTQQKPSDFDQLYNTGVALYQKGEFAEAGNYFDRAKQSPDPALKSKAAYNKGLAMAMQKHWQGAESEFQEALSYDNDNSMIADNLAWAKEQKKQQKPEDQKQQDPNKSDPNKSEQKDQKQADQNKSEQNKSEQKDQQQADPNKSDANKSEQQEAQEKNKSQQQQAQEKSGDPKKSEPQQAQEKSGDKQDASKLDQQAQEKTADKNQQKPEPPSPMVQDPNQAQEPGHADSKNQAMQSLTVKELKQQEAEKLLRSVDDRIGQYILTPEQANTEGKSRNGKEW